MSSTIQTAVNRRLQGAMTAKRTKLRNKSRGRRLAHYGLVAGNVLVLAVIGLFVARSSDSGAGLQGAPVAASAMAAKDDDSMADPLDQLSSADIAVNVARIANLPEAVAVTNQADSVNAQLKVGQAAGGLAAKPQIVASDFKSNKDIRTYVAQSGDTAASIAAKFGVTSDSVLWSNDLASDNIVAGQTLAIPPVNGIVYTVKSGDTPDSLATKYRTSKDKIIAYNDAELAGLKVGSRVIIPDGRIVREAAPMVRSRSGTAFPWGGGAVYNGANGYDYGYCTWYVANRISVPSNWGNANTWDNLAPQSGWAVSTVPRVGAIAQTDRGFYGHVAIVTAVEGGRIKYADMNGIAGWGREGHSDWVSAGRFEHYIYR